MYQQIAANKRRSVLLIAVIILVAIGLGYLFSVTSDFGPSILVLALLFAVGTTIGSWWAGDKVVLFTAAAKPIKKEDDLELYRIIENIAITAGLPMPRIYRIDDRTMNAFATGRDPEHASIAITTGLRNALEKPELEGVIAHELSHIKNFDTRFLMLTVILVGFVALLSDFFVRSQFFRGGNRRERGGALLLVGIVLAVLAPLFTKLIQLAVSRKREFLADASGALLTRYPQGLADALKKIATVSPPATRANKATASLYFTNPFGERRRSFSSFFSTHPPIQERIAALESMTAPL
ncbi:zinc metalloprotease HtpX [Candidatus Uhrbacteria bacterium CG10_big_fil_rev_8_21_14_0_10_48_11]|uniref:Protease HtpX homolog n=1 Tax=Candidatus Uhrbacteria bacterium CG10_big_fil_rev_8_21_14_0_10_48_11 TaxID=1975037 RepID=A0A2M8LFP1_9BACT|nr:MAG: zinc metalloprotease HtpX [Candidatus Uhrbacteria bacterium CG10_big_fil_rev_8_21_14_0_10_48_11]